MLPPAPLTFPARALTSLDVVSWRVVRPLASAGSLDGGLRPEGRAFSTCDGGRSICAGRMGMLACQGWRQMGTRIKAKIIVLSSSRRKKLGFRWRRSSTSYPVFGRGKHSSPNCSSRLFHAKYGTAGDSHQNPAPLDHMQETGATTTDSTGQLHLRRPDRARARYRLQQSLPRHSACTAAAS